MSEHIPASPEAIGNSTGLVYCKACGYLLTSDVKGRTKRADQPCTPVPVALRTDHPTPPTRATRPDDDEEAL